MSLAIEQYAVEALFQTLRDHLPSALLTADAARRARVVAKKGPYNIVAGTGDVLNVKGTGASATAKALTAGAARTAAQVAADINGGGGVPGVLASADADGRLVLTSTAAPTSAQVAQVRVEKGTAEEALGLAHRWRDSVIAALGTPAPRFVERDIAHEDQVTGPAVFLEQLRSVPVQPLRTELHRVAVRLHVLYPGPIGEFSATLEGVTAFARELLKVPAAGDGRGLLMIGGTALGAQIVICEPRGMQVQPIVWSIGNGPAALPIGRAFPEFEIEVYDP